MIPIIAILLIIGLAYLQTLAGKLCLGLTGLILLFIWPFPTIFLVLLIVGALVIKGGEKGLGVAIIAVAFLLAAIF